MQSGFQGMAGELDVFDTPSKFFLFFFLYLRCPNIPGGSTCYKLAEYIFENAPATQLIMYLVWNGLILFLLLQLYFVIVVSRHHQAKFDVSHMHRFTTWHPWVQLRLHALGTPTPNTKALANIALPDNLHTQGS